MKRHSFISAFLLVTLAIVLLSCLKKLGPAPSGVGLYGSTAPSSMKFTYNDSTVNLNTCIALSLSANNQSHINITGVNVTGGKEGNINMIIDIVAAVDSIKAGQIFNAASSFGQPGVEDLIFSIDTTAYVSQPAKPQGTVVITSVTSAYIKGTFTGTLYDGLDFDANKVLYTITNGSFIAKRE